MILEHCDIEIDPSKSAEFEEAILRGVSTVISKAKGFRGFKVNHSIESPFQYLLLIYWDSLARTYCRFFLGKPGKLRLMAA